MSATSVLARKWRPRSFAQLAGQEHVVQALTNALTQNRLHHAYLFTGTRGVGKTTIARIFAKSLNCETGVTPAPCGVCSACTEIDSGRFVDLIELDAASNTQVDNMRELLESALYAPTSGRFKVYIIDEVHMLSKSAFNAMLKTLEEPPAHVKFILATTDPQKIPVTVLSRCLQFNLKQLPPALINTHLQYVLEQEGIPFENGALNLVARAAQGSMRDALSLMDQAIAYSSGKVDEALVRTMLGAIDQGYLFDLLQTLRAGDGAGLLRIADDMAMRSLAFEAALQDMATLLHRIALAQTIPQAIPDDEPERARLFELAQQYTPEEIQLNYQIAIHGRNEIDLAPDEYAGFTMTLLRMLAFAPQGAAAGAGPAAPRTSAVTPGATRHVAAEPAPVRQEAAPVRNVAGTADLDWNTLLSQLNLQGMARELAKNSVLASFSDDRMVLSLAPQYKHLQGNKLAQDKLQAALSDYFVKPVRLAVELAAVKDVATPAAVEQHEKQTRQQQAEEAIRHDAFVREAQAHLGAQVIEGSIRPV
ncbi:holliday junction ATP-dependent DNA helicase RuvB [Sideroxyarcus emersonii]|uniref:DNA polymerase III subunit gamma/tau n=1 Tax=Sideroxyarcus emersonii TaxID=2764705 RepID=A0AAN1XAX6_9PROT|nr:DNA polymerase III subunit gamma/tau [Sideroxyarcus emersonii]BCK87916.1 holliday junction ATP-dependent DNA helicase RuvB [Sideroxyarcus emersonii]